MVVCNQCTAGNNQQLHCWKIKYVDINITIVFLFPLTFQIVPQKHCSRLAILFPMCLSNSAFIFYKLLIAVFCTRYIISLEFPVCLHMHLSFLFSNKRSVYFNVLICFCLHMYIFLCSLIGCHCMFAYWNSLW